eukprot:m.251586 g.251586  ORF g.251586 m.251586 type:complete len:338 (+) comp15456_c0_seq2:2496-3509(+)
MERDVALDVSETAWNSVINWSEWVEEESKDNHTVAEDLHELAVCIHVVVTVHSWNTEKETVGIAELVTNEKQRAWLLATWQVIKGLEDWALSLNDISHDALEGILDALCGLGEKSGITKLSEVLLTLSWGVVGELALLHKVQAQVRVWIFLNWLLGAEGLKAKWLAHTSNLASLAALLSSDATDAKVGIDISSYVLGVVAVLDELLQLGDRRLLWLLEAQLLRCTRHKGSGKVKSSVLKLLSHFNVDGVSRSNGIKLCSHERSNVCSCNVDRHTGMVGGWKPNVVEPKVNGFVKAFWRVRSTQLAQGGEHGTLVQHLDCSSHRLGCSGAYRVVGDGQ